MSDREIDELARAILERSQTVAVVGMSRRPGKAAYDVPAQLLAHGFSVLPVNPLAEEILGQKAYPSLQAIGRPVDLVDVFRPSEQAAEVAREAVASGAKALWLQLGITSAEARQIAQEAGLDYIEDRCIAIERRRLGMEKPAR